LDVKDNKKDVVLIFEIFLTSLKDWELSALKYVAFESDGTTIVRSKNGVTLCLRQKLNLFLISIHCVAYRTNFVVLVAIFARRCQII
jgi:hypothetical protein